jgi:tellurite resistance protein TehA-like permease
MALLLGCYGMFGISLFATLALLPLIWHRLGPGAVPTVWIVLGPLGQSITAANLLGHVARHQGRAPRQRPGPRAGPVTGWGGGRA